MRLDSVTDSEDAVPVPAAHSNLPALTTPMGGAFSLHEVSASTEQLAELGYGVKAKHPGGDAHLARLDASIETREIARCRAATIQRYTDSALDPLFFWPLCAAICQFTIHLFS